MVAQVSPRLKCNYIFGLNKRHLWLVVIGMLIEYLFEEFPNWEEIGELIGNLQVSLAMVD
jgi:hypothetical protein